MPHSQFVVLTGQRWVRCLRDRRLARRKGNSGSSLGAFCLLIQTITYFRLEKSFCRASTARAVSANLVNDQWRLTVAEHSC